MNIFYIEKSNNFLQMKYELIENKIQEYIKQWVSKNRLFH